MRNIIYTLISITIFLLFANCATQTVLANKVELGMTKEQVLRAIGNPFKRSAKYDKEENLQEILYYKEKTWDDGG